MNDGTASAAGFITHEVFNQPPPLIDYNLFTSDRALQEAVAREGGDWALQRLAGLAARWVAPRRSSGVSWRTATPRCCRASTATEGAATSSSSTPPGIR